MQKKGALLRNKVTIVRYEVIIVKYSIKTQFKIKMSQVLEVKLQP